MGLQVLRKYHSLSLHTSLSLLLCQEDGCCGSRLNWKELWAVCVPTDSCCGHCQGAYRSRVFGAFSLIQSSEIGLDLESGAYRIPLFAIV